MHLIAVKVSDKQKSRLRNGHKVRVKKPDMEGEGVFVVVNPLNYDLVTRSFKKSRGAEIALGPEEIQVNKSLSPEQHQQMLEKMKAEAPQSGLDLPADFTGQGIFGKKFDKFTKKVLGKKGNRILGKVAKNILLPIAKTGIDAASAALLATNPELASVVPSLGKVGKSYLENPQKYQRNPSRLGSEVAKDLTLKQLNEQLGTNYGSLSQSALGNAAANAASADLINRSVQGSSNLSVGQGLYAGGGLYASGRGFRKSLGVVGVGGTLVGHLHPAMQSQPYSANFQFGSTLPVAYQKYAKMGSGF